MFVSVSSSISLAGLLTTGKLQVSFGPRGLPLDRSNMDVALVSKKVAWKGARSREMTPS